MLSVSEQTSLVEKVENLNPRRVLSSTEGKEVPLVKQQLQGYIQNIRVTVLGEIAILDEYLMYTKDEDTALQIKGIINRLSLLINKLDKDESYVNSFIV